MSGTIETAQLSPPTGAELARPLRIGPLELPVPVVLAPMAGVTNAPFRTLCRRSGAGLYVSEMVLARALVEGGWKTWQRVAFAPGESPRSMQLYGTDPQVVAEAVRRLTGEGAADHIDMNFGCPAPKVTRRGGGAAVPARPGLLRAIVRAAVRAADAETGGRVPVTIKFRIGLDDARTTHLTTGRIAEEEGCAAVALHARTAEQRYSGRARWPAITELKQAVTSIPVLGNGDIWDAPDAIAMMRETGCDGVVVAGCLGRPWLFRDLVDALHGRPVRPAPVLGEVLPVMREHAALLADWYGERLGLRTSASTRAGTSRATRWARRCAVRWPVCRRWPSSTISSPGSMRRRPRPPGRRSRAATPTGPSRCTSRRAGSTRPTTPPRPRRPTPTRWSPVAEARLVLASASPRRRELLAHLGRPFDVVAPDVDETPVAGEHPAAMVGRLSVDKAMAVTAPPGSLVIAADTTVALGTEIIGKPLDADDAVATLRRLSGRAHEVHTGVALRCDGRIVHEVVGATIVMRELDDATIRWYVGTGEPLDKAGAYAVQGIGGMLVDRVEGNVQAVIGLPMATVCELAARLGVHLP